jgi:hypothetical protein
MAWILELSRIGDSRGKIVAFVTAPGSIGLCQSGVGFPGALIREVRWAQGMAERPQGHAPPTTARARRLAFWRDAGGREPWDALVVGGGVQGACAYHRLTAAGLRVLLVERRDFAAATSQASAMLVWGGLLYLRNGEWAEVRRLCAARDALARRYPHWVEPHRMRYVFGRPHRHGPAVVGAALALY